MNVEALAAQLASGDLAGLAAFGIAFLGGMAAGFGPCILPMVPAVFGYITGTVAGAENADASRSAPLRALALTVVFVLGMSTVFAAIGAVAGVLGHALIIGRWAYYVVAAVCVVIGLQMLEVIALPIDRLNAWLPMKRPERRGFLVHSVSACCSALLRRRVRRRSSPPSLLSRPRVVTRSKARRFCLCSGSAKVYRS